MGKIVKKRKLFVSKKSHYRQIAQIRKNKWAQKYQLQHQEQFKFHFCQTQDTEDNDYVRKEGRGDLKSEQKIKNRVAAQESRQKRKYYLEEMQKKLQLYEELLETKTCRLCLSTLKDKSQSQFGLSEQKGSTKEQVKQDYFQQGLIRVDNQGTSTPFAIFFFICFIVVLAIFTYGGQSMEQRILSHNQPIIHSATISRKQQHEVVVKQGHNIKQSPNYFDMTTKVVASNLQTPKHLRQSILSNNGKDWKRYKDLLCTKSQLIINNKTKQNKKPFLALRAKNGRQDINEQVQERQEEKESLVDKDLLNCIINEWKPI